MNKMISVLLTMFMLTAPAMSYASASDSGAKSHQKVVESEFSRDYRSFKSVVKACLGIVVIASVSVVGLGALNFCHDFEKDRDAALLRAHLARGEGKLAQMGDKFVSGLENMFRPKNEQAFMDFPGVAPLFKIGYGYIGPLAVGTD